MGLDMYLSKRSYVKNWDHNPKEEHYATTILKGGNPVTDIKPERISYIIESVGYWRKFNGLHQWFVDNVQDGEDNCQESYVGEEKLKELLATLEEIEADHSKADELLPTASGFFFGGTEYDEYYFSQIASTIILLKELIAEGGDFYYEASW